MASSHGGKKMWCVPTLDEEYVERMTEVVELYEQPYDERLPVVCLDEKLVELREDARPPKRVKGAVYRDHEYRRRGTANLFMLTEPKGGRHYVRVTRRRTAVDFAKCLRFLAKRYPDAITIHLVMDNLNTHCEKSLITAFGVVEGRRLCGRFTVHYTPKHGSWLNQAEIALCVMTRACLARQRIPSIDALRNRVVPFWAQRRRDRWTIDWRWTTPHMKDWVNSSGT